MHSAVPIFNDTRSLLKWSHRTEPYAIKHHCTTSFNDLPSDFPLFIFIHHHCQSPIISCRIRSSIKRPSDVSV